MTMNCAKHQFSLKEFGCSLARRCTHRSIAFSRGGAPATAPLSAPTMGLEETAAAPNAAPGGKHIEKGDGDLYFDWKLPAKEERTGSSTSTGSSLR